MRARFSLIFILLTAFLLPASFSQTPPPAPPFPIPSTFTATLPCADCSGIVETLTFLPNRLFLDRFEYQGRNTSSFDLGTWAPDSSGKQLNLFKGHLPQDSYEVVGSNRLRKLGPSGSDVPEQHLPTLIRSQSLALPSPAFPIRGEYIYDPAADISDLVACQSQARIRVLSNSSFTALLNAYTSAKVKQGSPLLVTILASVNLSGDPSNSDAKAYLSVERVDSSWPGKSCFSAPGEDFASPVDLFDKRWTLIELDRQNLDSSVLSNPPYIELTLDGNHLSGFDGCNRLVGSFSLVRDAIEFKPVGTTMMACAPSVMDFEQKFQTALESVNSYHLDGAILELRQDATLLARFRADVPDTH